MRLRLSVILLTTLATVSVFGGAAAPQSGTAGEGETAGWLRAGRKIPFPATGRRGSSGLQGSFDILSSTDDIRALEAWRDTVWVGTEGGLFAWALSSDTLLSCAGPAFTGITCIAVAGEELWVGGDAGISVRGRGRWRHYTKGRNRFFSHITDISTGERRVWISTWGNGAGCIEDDTLRIFTMADSLLDDRVSCTVEENPYTIWFGTASGVCRTDSFSWQSMRYGRKIPVGRVEDMIIDEGEELFIAVAGQGVSVYSYGRVRNFGPGLPSSDVMSLSLDGTGTVWAAGRRGASMWDGSGWTPARVPGLSLVSYDLLSADHDTEGRTFMGSSNGRVIALSREGFREKRIEGRFPENTVTGITGGGGSVWLTGREGVYRYDRAVTRYALPDPWFESMVSGLAVEGERGFWLATRLGILHYTGAGWEVYDRRNGLPTENFTDVVSAEGELWFSTFDSGVLRLTTDGWIHYTERQGLPGLGITGLVSDRNGTVWAADMSGSVARFTGGGWQTMELPGAGTAAEAAPADSFYADDPAIRFLRGSASDEAFSSSAVLGLDGSGRCMIALPEVLYIQTSAGWSSLESPLRAEGLRATALAGTLEGDIWVGSEEGVFVLAGGSWTRLDASSGLSSDHVTSIFQDGKAAVWIGTADGGITRYVKD